MFKIFQKKCFVCKDNPADYQLMHIKHKKADYNICDSCFIKDHKTDWNNFIVTTIKKGG